MNQQKSKITEELLIYVLNTLVRIASLIFGERSVKKQVIERPESNQTFLVATRGIKCDPSYLAWKGLSSHHNVYYNFCDQKVGREVLSVWQLNWGTNQ